MQLSNTVNQDYFGQILTSTACYKKSAHAEASIWSQIVAKVAPVYSA